MTQNRLKLSIVLAAYNEEQYIASALNSIIEPYGSSKAASLYELEVVAVDDQSTDRTYEILCGLDYPGLKVLRNPTKGKVQAFNYGLEQSSGEFLILFAGDDLFNVDAIAPRLEPICNSAGPAASFCAIQAFRDEPENLAQRFPRRGGGARAGGAIAMNRKFVDSFWPIPTELPNEDSWMCLHADYLDAETADVDVVGMYYRLHRGNTSGYGSQDAAAQQRALLARSRVYSQFYWKWAKGMTDANRIRLSREISAHALAESGNTLSILLLSGYPLARRIRAAFLSRTALWTARAKVGARVSGLVRA